MNSSRITSIASATAAALFLLSTLSAGAASPPLALTTTAHIGAPLSGVLWTGSRFVFTVEGGRTILQADARLGALRPFAVVPRNTGEMRCVVADGSFGPRPGDLYCHAAQGPIYRISGDGHQVTLLATVPGTQGSDGALALASGSQFGNVLLAATGGSDAGSGGTVYAVDAHGAVRRIGPYTGPGGAENALVAPAGLGAISGQLLLTIDKHDRQGRLLAMDAHGRVTVVAQGLSFGLNPLIPLGQAAAQQEANRPVAGLYLADWLSKSVLFAPASELQRYSGSLLVGTERHGHLYLLKVAGGHYGLQELQTNLHAPDYNFEGAQWVP